MLKLYDSFRAVSPAALNALAALGRQIYSTTLISGTRGVKNGVKGRPKRHLLHRVDHVTVSHISLCTCEKLAENGGPGGLFSAPFPPESL
jgi:hypothetical protein